MELVQPGLFGGVMDAEPKEGTPEWGFKLLSEFYTKSIEEGGLYTGSAAARVLGVSPQRVAHLGQLGKLTVFELEHGTFYSGNELRARLKETKSKGGRPRLRDHADIKW